jgi:GNAT superfamily N-acetyltransferase
VLQVVDLKTDEQHRNKGEATKLMQELCRRADLSNFLLILTPESRSLESFYKKFGFTTIQHKPSHIMCRDPKRKVWNIETDEVAEVGGH